MKETIQWLRNILVGLGAIASLVTILAYFLPSSAAGNISIKGSTFDNSPVIQNSPGTSVSYGDETEIFDPSFYARALTLTNRVGLNFSAIGGAGNFYRIKIILPDNTFAYLKEFLVGIKYDVARCNWDLTDCKVFKKYKFEEGYNSDICWGLDETKLVKLTTGELIISEERMFRLGAEDSKCFTLVTPAPR